MKVWLWLDDSTGSLVVKTGAIKLLLRNDKNLSIVIHLNTEELKAVWVEQRINEKKHGNE